MMMISKKKKMMMMMMMMMMMIMMTMMKIPNPFPSQDYDLVAARPTSDKAFQHVCASADVDIISLDLASRLPFFPTTKQARLPYVLESLSCRTATVCNGFATGLRAHRCRRRWTGAWCSSSATRRPSTTRVRGVAREGENVHPQHPLNSSQPSYPHTP
jgi:hypothetical protein